MSSPSIWILSVFPSFQIRSQVLRFLTTDDATPLQSFV